MDPRQNVNPGEPIRLAASQINGLNRLLNVNAGFSSPAAVEQPTPYTWVMAKNNTGSNVERWGVLAITGMDITPGSSETATGQFEQLPVVAGGTPSDATTSWCVAVEPIAAGKIGRVAVGGVVQLKAADLDKATGAEVLWKDSNWALIRLSSGGSVKRGTFTAPWTKGSTKTVADAVTSGTTYSDVKNYFAAVGGTGTKACAIAYVGTEWILIAAEC
jgi:predicted RecA/RadA family phage recombinase